MADISHINLVNAYAAIQSGDMIKKHLIAIGEPTNLAIDVLKALVAAHSKTTIMNMLRANYNALHA